MREKTSTKTQPPSTQALIASLATSPATQLPWPIRYPFVFWVTAPALLVVFLFVINTELQFRADLNSAFSSVAYLLKFGLALTCAGVASYCLWLSARPAKHPSVFLILVPVIIAFVIIGNAFTSPSDSVFNGTGYICLAYVSGLSLPAMALSFAYLRHMAPTQPSWAGFWAGLASAGLAATAYALHCPYDQASYVVMWYMPALLLPALAGAMAGRRLLRWS